MVYLPIAPIRADLSLYLHCPEDFLSPEQIEGHLSAENSQTNLKINFSTLTDAQLLDIINGKMPKDL